MNINCCNNSSQTEDHNSTIKHSSKILQENKTESQNQNDFKQEIYNYEQKNISTKQQIQSPIQQTVINQTIFTVSVTNQQTSKQINNSMNQNPIFLKSSEQPQCIISQSQQQLNESQRSQINCQNAENFDKNFQQVDKMAESKMKKIQLREQSQSSLNASESEQLNQLNDFNTIDNRTVYQSLLNQSTVSKTNDLQVNCYYCNQKTFKNYIQMSCLHFFCKECFKEQLKTQCSLPNCIYFTCICTEKISVKTILQYKQDQLIPVLLERLWMNQLRKLLSICQQNHLVQSCPNKYCIFFCIIQPNLNQKTYFCPNCLIQQSIQKQKNN